MNIYSAALKFKKQIEFFHKFKLVDKAVLIICTSLNLAVLVAEALGFASLFPLMTFIEKGRSVNEFAQVSDLHAAILHAHNALNVQLTLASLMLVTFTFVTFRQVINYYAAVYNEHLKWRVGIDLGRLVVGTALDSNSKYINKTDRGDFIVTCDYECQAVSTILSIHIMLFRACISFLAYVVIVLFASPGPAIISLLLFFVLSVAMGFLIKRAHQTGRRSVTVRRQFVNTISEIYGAWKTIKLYNTENFERDRYSLFGSRLTDVRVSLAKISGLIELIFLPAVLAVLLSMAFLMLEWLNLSVSVVLIYIATMVRLMPISKDFQRRFAMLAQYDPSMTKVLNVIEEARSNSEQRDEGRVFSNFKKNIEFKNVSFRYDEGGSEVISDVNILFPKGNVIAIVGPSGVGKSTLTDLIMGIISPTNGQVLIDGTPLNNYSLASVRQNIAVVTQDTFLFNQSIRDNLCYGLSVADDKIWSVLRLLNLSDFVSRLPVGLDTTIADSGKNLSGGQKQRIAIARALIKDTPIIILDEPTSALDSLSETEVVHILKTMVRKSKKTVIMVAHRQAAIDASDMVVNLSECGVSAELNPNNAKLRAKKS